MVFYDNDMNISSFHFFVKMVYFLADDKIYQSEDLFTFPQALFTTAMQNIINNNFT